jgi:hypothetical protein
MVCRVGLGILGRSPFPLPGIEYLWGVLFECWLPKGNTGKRDENGEKGTCYRPFRTSELSRHSRGSSE